MQISLEFHANLTEDTIEFLVTFTISCINKDDKPLPYWLVKLFEAFLSQLRPSTYLSELWPGFFLGISPHVFLPVRRRLGVGFSSWTKLVARFASSQRKTLLGLDWPDDAHPLKGRT